MRRRKRLDPTYPIRGSPHSLPQPPLAIRRDVLDGLAIDFDSLAPPLETRGPLSCPLPASATGFFHDALGSAAFQATRSAKPRLHLNATCSTYEEIGRAVVAQYEVVFAPIDDVSAPRLSHARSGSDLHDPSAVRNSSQAHHLYSPNWFSTRVPKIGSQSSPPPLNRPQEMDHSFETLSLLQSLGPPASAGSAGHSPTSLTGSSVSSSASSCSLPSSSVISWPIFPSYTNPALASMPPLATSAHIFSCVHPSSSRSVPHHSDTHGPATLVGSAHRTLSGDPVATCVTRGWSGVWEDGSG